MCSGILSPVCPSFRLSLFPSVPLSACPYSVFPPCPPTALPGALAFRPKHALRGVAHDAFGLARQPLEGAAGGRRSGPTERLDGSKPLPGGIPLAPEQAPASQGHALQSAARLGRPDAPEGVDECKPGVTVALGLERGNQQQCQHSAAPDRNGLGRCRPGPAVGMMELLLE